MTLKNREKIMIVFALIAVGIWTFDILYYTPQSRKLLRLRGEVKAADLKLSEYQLLLKGVETLEADVLRHEGELERLSERTLKGKKFNAFLKHLAKESDSLQMKVVSLTPREEKLPPEGNKEPSVSPYRKVFVQMVLHSTYNKLGTYLKGIQELPLLINVDNIQLEKNEEIQPLLKVTMGLSIYITS
jgi:hypothetical protein